MALSSNEIRDITKLLEAGKPLPDEYRFKLFNHNREVELIWNGKTNEVESAVLPFQYIEIVDEPRSEEAKKAQLDMFDFSGRQIGGWTNKLIWGENKYILSSLKNGPLRKEIEDNGGIKLIYIDPPFDVGADFSMDIEVGGETLTKKPNVLEEIAYRDTWGKGADSFISMIYERLQIMHDLLAEDGCIYVHCDWRVDSYMRLVLDEIFGKSNYLNELRWLYRGYEHSKQHWNRKHDTILVFAKQNGSQIFNYKEVMEPLSEATLAKYKFEDKLGRYRLRGRNIKNSPFKQQSDLKPEDEKKYPDLIYRQYMTDGILARDWFVIDYINQAANENLYYPTQKPELLLEKILKASSNKGDLVADFFMGSGTTMAVAEKLGRKWIGSDLGKFSIHTARKRMIGVQRQLKGEGKDYRAFEVLNLGKYQRQAFYHETYVNEEEAAKAKLQRDKQEQYIDLILTAYKAERTRGDVFVGQNNNRFVVVGPLDLPMTQGGLEDVIGSATHKGITKIDVLAFEYEMGLVPFMQEEAKQKGIDLALKVIPPDVFDKRAVEKGQVKFYDVAYIEVKPHFQKGNSKKNPSVAIELTDFSVHYNQDIDEKELKPGSSKVVIRDGQVLKLHKDKESEIVDTTILTERWTDWIDYWSVDFNYESRKEIVQTKTPDGNSLKYVATWTGDYVFENEWQDFRTKKKRDLELKTAFHECKPGKYKIAIKVVDIFGNDTMKVIEVSV